MKKAHKKWLAIGAKFLVSAGLIYWLFSTKVDLSAVKDRIAGVDPAMVALAALLFLAQVPIAALRWDAVLRALECRLPFIQAVRIFYIGAFFNQTLPSSVGGDAVRIYLAYRQGLTLGRAINGVMLERATTVVALVLVVAATQPLFLPRVSTDDAALVLPAVALLAVAAVGGLGLLMVLDRLPESYLRWRLVRGLTLLAGDTRRVFLSAHSAARALGWAVVGHVNLAIGVFVLAVGLDVPVTWVDCLALVPPVILVTTLPISIAGWGVREAAMVVAFGLVGVSQDGATALSLLVGLVVVAISVPGGIVWLLSGARRGDVEAMPENS